MTRWNPSFVTAASLAALLSLASAAPAAACTLWAAAGPDAAGGGTLLSKNRDWLPDQQQTMQFRVPHHGIPYFGLFAEGGRDSGIKAGVNARGLSIVSASASSLPRALRARQPGKHGILGRILAHYVSVADLAAHADAVFSGARAEFVMVSDRHQVLLAEIGLDGRYAVRTIDRGSLAHTNYFQQPSLADFNVKVGRSSAARAARIKELLVQGARPYTLPEFVAMSRDHDGGPDDSLWRTGHEQTVASWIIDSPAQGPQTLRVVLDNPGQPETVQTYRLDPAFWAQAGSTGPLSTNAAVTR